jgi:hypothetical protein
MVIAPALPDAMANVIAAKLAIAMDFVISPPSHRGQAGESVGRGKASPDEPRDGLRGSASDLVIAAMQTEANRVLLITSTGGASPSGFGCQRLRSRFRKLKCAAHALISDISSAVGIDRQTVIGARD